MAYMSRLGIWGPGTPFREFSDFIQAVEKRGVGAMEIVAMDMKWIEAREKFEQAAELMGADGRAKKTIWGQFWSAHQCVIVGLQSTAEARTLEQLEESGGDLTDFVSTAKGVLQSLIKKHFPAPGNKLEELFGFDSGTNGRSSPSSQQLTPVKRKKKGW
ncbi:PREDICTED: protein strawberry notch homolog 1-like isoform X2 [Acropora digitifera]|uniref:protein strawberry notch homolog 1-like isoform X2 n=1 Tax=Acropora digitifera TaxID=70779 RepID=UPI00077AC8A9|nr:PREDICTED: protein strawberry notch homolog 1-like isoform X2 [Acropora digitifera]